ncbi:MAG: TonB-dependent receptor [Sphingobacteriia bacterium]|nr:MAG: TonB-dependent receptor [Sphingobacteriia bacterium]TAG29533.1 MAG: TonB-dependent receptor [Sphingobacteriia bacterium]
MLLRIGGVSLGLLFSVNLWSQQSDTLSGTGNEIVVTATKTERKISSVAVPVTIISQQRILQAGSLRLNDILQEQTGLFLTAAFGSGVQMQGLNPDYTLILIDGEPLIGRTGGVLDLKRITVGNIKQIEIVKGPSSSLYGSEAMAGVINIITDKPKSNALKFSLRYGSFNTADLSLNGSIRKNNFTYQGFGNFYKTDGFSIRPNSSERAIAPIERFTQQHNFSYRFNNKTVLSINLRLNNESIKNIISVNNNGTIIQSEGLEKNKDLNTTVQLSHRLNEKITNNTRIYATEFSAEQQLLTSNGTPYTDFFKQRFARAENQTDFTLNKKLSLTTGAGYIIETANSTRYDKSSNTKTNRIGYAFIQSEWKPTDAFTIVAGARYDHNELFAAAFSPKLAFQYKFNPKFSLKASIGRGFKAPDFRQLYLNFTNTAAGSYSVFGTVEAQKIIAELNRIGQISSLESDYYRLSELKPEFATGINIGLSYNPITPLSITANIFSNTIENLIDSRLVAYKTGGAQIFSYLNVKHAFTKGIETDIKYALSKKWSLAGGYQFLLTGDKDEINRINNGQVFTRDANGFSSKLKRSEYVGLANRSKHMANFRVQFEQQNYFANLRLIYRSKWAVSDKDGNGLFNTNDAFADGFIQVNMATGKNFNKGIRVQAGCDNILNYTDVLNLPNLPGRTFYFTLAYTFLNTKTKQ